MIDKEIPYRTTSDGIQEVGKLTSEGLGTTACSMAGLLVLLVLLGASSGSGQVAGRLDGYNVLLITIDTLRADRLGAYGYDGVETPNIDRLAGEGSGLSR